jgi:hypothetical protein
MLVWGGSWLDTGAFYDPAGDTWSPPISVDANTPVGRVRHSTVWTGSEMIVWGGEGSGGSPDYFSSGGRYCVCAPTTYYRDADGDGFGVSTESVSSCSAPAGYVAIAGDCNDANSSLHPGATEACNGLDDDCDAIVDNGGTVLCNDGNVCTNDACQGVTGCAHAFNAAPCDDGNPCTSADTCSAGVCASGTPVLPPPEIDGVSVNGHGPTTLSWTGLGGSATYDLATSTLEDLRANATATAICLADNVPLASYVDAQPDPAENTGTYYLVRASTACGTGGYGFDSSGVERIPAAACP